MVKLGPLRILTLFQAVMAILTLSYAAISGAPSEEFEFLIGWGSALGIGLWVLADVRKRRRIPCFDFGQLVPFTLPMSLAWYVFSSRGLIPGLAMLLLLVLLWITPMVCLSTALKPVD